MKKLLCLSALAIALSGAVISCKDKDDSRADKKNVIETSAVPSPVSSAFMSKYDGASEIIWENAHEGDEDTYKVKFKRDGKYWKAEFKPDGTLVKEKED